jgi:Ni,Fe-hydrogenase I cytochrome b subunit
MLTPITTNISHGMFLQFHWINALAVIGLMATGIVILSELAKRTRLLAHYPAT